ncbi:hypothetical protein QQG55_2000 [Brugia pahangi]
MYNSSTRWSILAQQRKAFVNPQSECRIKCLNGGFCAYLVDDPSIHTCLCLLNVYYGDRCQYAVVETTTLATSVIPERPFLHHSGRERSRSEQQRYELSSPIKTEQNFDDKTIKYNEISQLDHTKVYQIKQSKSTEETKLEENDYTEGWDTRTGEDDEYLYEDHATDHSESTRTESSMPAWLQGSDDYQMITEHGNAQRIYLNKKKTDQMITRLNKDKRMKVNEDALVPWTNENDNFDSDETMTETDSLDDGWMISKRRRVITNGATVITNHLLQSVFFYIFIVIILLR